MSCKHYWICSLPINGLVQTTCRFCGEIKFRETHAYKINKKDNKDQPKDLYIKKSWYWDSEPEIEEETTGIESKFT